METRVIHGKKEEEEMEKTNVEDKFNMGPLSRHSSPILLYDWLKH